MLRQTGAMLGLDTAEREGWWSGYDCNTERRGACLRWRSEHAVTPDMSWGTLPAVLQEKWTAYDCDHLVQDAIQREDEEARARTVRRGWNRTAGSRYEFAADGVTFESSGGI